MTGPDEGTRAGRGHLRAAQADREQAITVLKAAYAQGRLTKDELELRAGQAFASKTYAELAALTADIPPVSPAGSPAVPPAGRPPSTPARTLGKAACRSGVCLLAAVALAEGSFLVGNFLLIVAACFALIAASGFFGYGILDAWQERRSRGQLPPKPGQGSDGRPPGDDAPPGGISWTRADPARADETRADGTRADVRRHSASVTLAPPYGPLWMPLLLLTAVRTGMDAAFMLFQRRGWGIHVVSAGRTEAMGEGFRGLVGHRLLTILLSIFRIATCGRLRTGRRRRADMRKSPSRGWWRAPSGGGWRSSGCGGRSWPGTWRPGNGWSRRSWPGRSG